MPDIILCCCLVAQSCPALCHPMDCRMPDFPVLHHHPELAQTYIVESVMSSNHLILCRPRLLLPLIFPSIRVFSNESVLHIRYWSFSFSISSSNEYSGLISFRMDWSDLRAVQGTLKSPFQHHSSKASVLHLSATPINLSRSRADRWSSWKNDSYRVIPFKWQTFQSLIYFFKDS